MDTLRRAIVQSGVCQGQILDQEDSDRTVVEPDTSNAWAYLEGGRGGRPPQSPKKKILLK